jgi:hypothetical protein
MDETKMSSHSEACAYYWTCWYARLISYLLFDALQRLNSVTKGQGELRGDGAKRASHPLRHLITSHQ